MAMVWMYSAFVGGASVGHAVGGASVEDVVRAARGVEEEGAGVGRDDTALDVERATTLRGTNIDASDDDGGR